MARGGGEEGFRRLFSRDSSSLSYRTIFRPNRMPRVSSRTKTRNIGRDAISGFVYVGSDPRLGSRKKEKKKRKEKHNEELSKLFQVFRKSFLLYHRVHNHEEIIVFLKKSTKKAGSHVTYGW